MLASGLMGSLSSYAEISEFGFVTTPFDVLAQGWRQPGSSIKPIHYAIGIDDKTVTAATRSFITIDLGAASVGTASALSPRR